MPAKIAPQTKQLALQKLRQGMTTKEVAELTGVSTRTLERWHNQSAKGATLPARKAGQTTPSPTAPETGNAAPLPSHGGDDGAILDFQESPAPVDTNKKGLVESGMDTLRGLLGLAPKSDEKKATAAVAPLAAKLDPRRQQFVDSVAPSIALGFVVLAGMVWSRIGPEYQVLAPDDTTAEKIMTPLVRIYARHANFLTEVNPDVADAGASLFALFGYMHVSLGLYQKIKQDSEEEYYAAAEHGYGPGGPAAYNGARSYRAPGGQNGLNGAGGGRSDVSGSGQGHAEPDGGDVRYAAPLRGGTLTAKEQRQSEALSRLAQLDYLSRLRRSGQLRSVYPDAGSDRA